MPRGQSTRFIKPPPTRCRELRTSIGLNQHQLGVYSHTSADFVRRLEDPGGYDNVSLRAIFAISAVLGVSPVQLIPDLGKVPTVTIPPPPGASTRTSE